MLAVSFAIGLGLVAFEFIADRTGNTTIVYASAVALCLTAGLFGPLIAGRNAFGLVVSVFVSVLVLFGELQLFFATACSSGRGCL